MNALPSGLVAFLLLDVEASTYQWNVSAPEMDVALVALDQDVQSIVVAHDGAIIKARGEGDSHFCVFTLASQAVESAAAIQRRPDQRLAVRAAVLLGEAHPRDGDYVGGIVNHGARIRSTAHGGQVIATSSVVDVVQGRLAADLSFRTLGPHHIRDIPRAVELFQLHGPGLRRSFPPLHTPANRAAAVMAVAVVDEVGATRRFDGTDDDLLAWQRTLIHTLRELSEHHDGRYLKLVGDGCVVGFEDPRVALEFARAARDRLPVRIGIAVGLIEVVEGELTGRVVFDAYQLMRNAAGGEIRTSSLMLALCGLECPVPPGG
jgi:class 3 adenylate cyclase